LRRSTGESSFSWSVVKPFNKALIFAAIAIGIELLPLALARKHVYITLRLREHQALRRLQIGAWLSGWQK
jgi:hypothetical protein